MKITIRQINWNYHPKINLTYKDQVRGEILNYISRAK
jgi:hypothetical protein